MEFWRLLGYSKVSFHHHPKPVAIETKDGRKTDLLELAKSATPPCRLNPFLFNGHLQTFWTAVKSLDIPIYYKRKIFEAEDPTYAGTFAVDFVVQPYQDTDDTLPPRTTYFKDAEFEDIGSSDTKPMVVVLHGLSGGSHEIYLRQTLRPIVESGWEACVVNSRGCAKSKITTAVLYNARATWDLRQMVNWLKKTFPNRPLYGLGFSLGANMMVNVCMLGQLGLHWILSGSDRCNFSRSTWAKKVRIAYSRPQWCAQTRGTVKLVLSPCKDPGLGSRCIREPWVPA